MVKAQSSLPDNSAEPARGTLAPVSPKPVVPEHVRALLGPSWLIEGEQPELYEKLLAEVGAAVQPTDCPPRLLPLIPPKPVVPEDVRPLLGPSWLIEGEDPKLYEALLAKVGAAVQPVDFIDWHLVKDIVDITWDIQRSRRQCDSLMRTVRRQAMEQILNSILETGITSTVINNGNDIDDEIDAEKESELQSPLSRQA